MQEASVSGQAPASAGIPQSVSSGVTVRLGRPSDLETVVQFNQSMAHETEGIEIPADVAQRGAAAVLEGRAAAGGAMYFLLEEEGQVVGQLMITTEWSDWRACVVWWIQSVYVLPGHRRRGHFGALYRHVREAAEAAGAAGLRLYADDGNTKAHDVYTRQGMSSHYRVFEDMFTAY